MPRISLFSSSDYVRPDGFGGLATPPRGEISAYEALERAVLGHYSVTARRVKDFRISVGAKVAYYTHPETGDRVEVDLLAEPEIRAAYKAYERARPGAQSLGNHHSVVANSKGDQRGKASLQRPKGITQTALDLKGRLPQLLTQYPSGKEGKQVAKRFIFIEAYLHKNKARVQELIEEKEKSAKQSGLSDAEAGLLRRDLEGLRRLKSELDSIDLFAIQTVLEHLPPGRLNQALLQGKEEEIRKAVTEAILKSKGFFRKKLTQADHEYINDVVGMLHQGRKSYFDYAERVFGARAKKAHASDAIMRMVLMLEEGKTEKQYEKEGFFHSALFENLSDELRGQFEGLSLVALHSVSEMHDFEYDEPTLYPDSLKDEEKPAYFAEKRSRSIAKHVKAAIEKMDMSPDALSMPAIPAPGPMSVVRTGLGVAALGVGAAAAARFAGAALPVSVGGALAAAGSSPGRAGVALVLADGLRDRVKRFLWKRVRDPLTGRVSAHFSRRQAMKLGVGALALGTYGWISAYSAASSAPPGLFAYSGMLGASALNAAASVADTVWSMTHFPTGLGPVNIPLTNWQWQGTLPILLLIHAGNRLAQCVPVVRNVADLVYRPLRYVALTSNLIPAVQSIGGGIASRVGVDTSGITLDNLQRTTVKVASSAYALKDWAVGRVNAFLFGESIF